MAKYLERILRREDSTPRISVLVVLLDESGSLAPGGKVITDKVGRFRIDIDSVPPGVYHLEYYGDGIIPTIFNSSGNILEEDAVTPWEYGIEIEDPGIPSNVLQKASDSKIKTWDGVVHDPLDRLRQGKEPLAGVDDIVNKGQNVNVLVDGQTVTDNASDGKTAHTETTQFRDDTAPNGSFSDNASPVQSAINRLTGTVEIRWGFAQGTQKVHGFIIRWSHGPATGQTVNTASPSTKVDSTVRKFSINIPADDYITLQVYPYYSSKSGTQEGSSYQYTHVSNPDWVDYQPSANPSVGEVDIPANFIKKDTSTGEVKTNDDVVFSELDRVRQGKDPLTGNNFLVDKGDPVSELSDGQTVTDNAVDGKTSFNDTVQFRGDVAPNGSFSAGTTPIAKITKQLSAVISIEWGYSQGANNAHGFIVRWSHGPSTGQVVTTASPSRKLDSTVRKFLITIPSTDYITIKVYAYYAGKSGSVEDAGYQHANWVDYQAETVAKLEETINTTGLLMFR